MTRKRCGAYLLTVGEKVYVGSSWSLDKRRAQHIADLRKGIHSCKALQKAWDKDPENVAFTVARPVKHNGETDDELKATLRTMEQELLDMYKGHVNLTNKSTNARGPDNGQLMKQKWQNPAFREYMTNLLKEKKKTSPTSETRAKMGAAKRGARNPNATPVRVTMPDNTIHFFDTTTEAAQHLGVSQQRVNGWLSGKVALPGRGKYLRHKTEHLRGMIIEKVNQ